MSAKPSADEKADKLSEWERDARAKLSSSDPKSQAARVLKLIAAVRVLRGGLSSRLPRPEGSIEAIALREAEAILAGEGADASRD